MPQSDLITAKVEIHDLVNTFAEIVNEMRPADMKDVFVPDAEFVIKGWAEMHGIGEIVGFLTGVIGHWDVILQTIASGRVTLDGDEATGSWFVTEYGRYRDGNETFLGGRYRDRYVKTSEGWRFTRREFRGLFRRAAPAGEAMQVWPFGQARR